MADKFPAVPESRSPSSPDPYEANHELIERAIRCVCRQSRLRTDEAEEVAGRARVALLENDRAKLRQYRGAGTMWSYLTIVVGNVLRDYRREKWGKWHASAPARRAGPLGERFEQLLNRDRLPFDEAIARLAAEGFNANREVLEKLAARLPARTRREFVDVAVLETVASMSPDVEALLVREEQESAFRRVIARVNALMECLPDRDRFLVRLHFESGLTVADIARQLHVKQKKLYPAIHRVLDGLLEALELEGIRTDEIKAMLRDRDWNLSPGETCAPVRLEQRRPQ